MRRRLVPWAALVALALLAPAARPAEQTAKPAVIFRAASVDDLVADLRFLVAAAGKEDEAKNIEGLLKAKTGGKGLEGVDPTRPLGAYVIVGPQGIDSIFAVLVPVTDEKSIIETIKNFTGKEPPSEDGIYTLELEKVQVPVYFRFAHKYLYITALNKENIEKNKILAPEEVLSEAKGKMAGAVVHLDRIPDELKNMALGMIDVNLGRIKEQNPPGETPAQTRLRTAAVDEVSRRIKEVLREGGAVDLHLNVDRSARELSISLSLAGKPGSGLADSIRELGKVSGVGAALVGPDSAASVVVDVSLPANLRKALAPVIDEAEKMALSEAKDKRELVASLIEAVKPTLKSAELDGGFDIRGPSTDGKYTMLAGLRVKDGVAIDKVLHKAADEVPAKDRDQIKLDFEKVGNVAIHKITPNKVDEDVKQLLGNHPFYLAAREDAIFVAAGEKGLEVLKEAIGSAPKAGRVLQFDVSFARLAPLMEKENKGATEIAHKVFKDKDSDKLRVTISGGESLKLRMSMKATLLMFFTQLDEAKKGG